MHYYPYAAYVLRDCLGHREALLIIGNYNEWVGCFSILKGYTAKDFNEYI